MNLTDSEIIKALECCCVSECDECPYDEQTACVEILKEGTLALINRQQAEIERWRANYTLPKEGFFNVLCGALVYTKTLEEYNQFRRIIKSEAIKEFAERVRKIITIKGKQKDYFDNLVKEMVGKDDVK